MYVWLMEGARVPASVGHFPVLRSPTSPEISLCLVVGVGVVQVGA